MLFRNKRPKDTAFKYERTHRGVIVSHISSFPALLVDTIERLRVLGYFLRLLFYVLVNLVELLFLLKLCEPRLKNALLFFRVFLSGAELLDSLFRLGGQ